MFLKHCWPGLLWTLTILILTGLPGNVFPKVASWLELVEPDKIIHLLIFCILVILWAAGLFRYLPGQSRELTLFYALLIGIIVGGTTEILQKYVFISRYASLYDYLANVAGCLLGLIILEFLRKKKIFIPGLSFSEDRKVQDTP